MKVLALVVARGLKLVCRFGGRVSGTWGPYSRGTYEKDDNVLGSIEGAHFSPGVMVPWATYGYSGICPSTIPLSEAWCGCAG